MNNQNWFFHLNPVLTSPKMTELKQFIQNERQNHNVYPASGDVFKAFELCSYENTRVVILGQDPYHTQGTAHGLCFSSLQQKRPPSLNVIFNEIYRDLNIQYDFNITQEEMFRHNNLTSWTTAGFLLLNTILTVREGSAGSHKGLGWELVTQAAIETLNKKDKPVVFLLWGKEAQAYKSLITGRHIILEAPHPAAELYAGGKAGFYGCKHFSILRDILPEIHAEDERMVIDMSPFFKRTKAAKYIRERFPEYADDAEYFIMHYLNVPIWLNPHHRIKYYEEFKNMLSTKLNDQTK